MQSVAMTGRAVWRGACEDAGVRTLLTILGGIVFIACSGAPEDSEEEGDESAESALDLDAGLPSAASPPVGAAGAIYGTITAAKGPLAGATLTVGCPTLNDKTVTTTTDERGGFSILPSTVGRCTARVSNAKLAGPAFYLTASERPIRRDLRVDETLAPF